jgi:hypothetical protein
MKGRPQDARRIENLASMTLLGIDQFSHGLLLTLRKITASSFVATPS